MALVPVNSPRWMDGSIAQELDTTRHLIYVCFQHFPGWMCRRRGVVVVQPSSSLAKKWYPISYSSNHQGFTIVRACERASACCNDTHQSSPGDNDDQGKTSFISGEQAAAPAEKKVQFMENVACFNGKTCEISAKK